MDRHSLFAGMIAIGTAAHTPLVASGQVADTFAISAEEFEQLSASIEQFRQELRLPGLAIGIVMEGELAYSRGFGVRDLASGDPVDGKTLFQIGSITKAFATTLLAQQAVQGHLDWDAPLSRYLSPRCGENLPAESDRITLGMIARHRAGLPSRPTNLPPKQSDGLVRSYTHFELYQALCDWEVESPPGDRFGYSNFGYGILGHLIEEATGQAFEHHLRNALLDPLGMGMTTMTILPEHTPVVATAYHLDESGAPEMTLRQSLGALGPAGGLSSSVEELTSFLALHMGDSGHLQRVGLSTAALEMLHETVSITEGNTLGYGIGWASAELPFGRVIFHDGGSDGFTTYIGFAEGTPVGVIVLTNLGSETAARPIRGMGQQLLATVVERLGKSD